MYTPVIIGGVRVAARKKDLERARSFLKQIENRARTKMLVASNMAIMSFAMSGMFYPVHNIAHAVGGQIRIPTRRGKRRFTTCVAAGSDPQLIFTNRL